MTKSDEIREFISRSAKEALEIKSARMVDRGAAETVRQYSETLALHVGWHIAEKYRLLELFDLMEWKRTRVRR